VRIIGGHDYYDSALAYGQDEKVVFVRTPVEMHLPDLKLAAVAGIPELQKVGSKGLYRHRVYDGEWNGKKGTWGMEALTVIFCGEIFGGIRLTHQTFGIPESTERIFWDEKEFKTFLSRHCDLEYREKRVKYTSEDKTIPFIRQKLTGEALDIILDKRIVVARRASRERWLDNRSKQVITVNGDGLKHLEFYKVKDAYTAFQEISMFVGGVLPAQGNEMVEISERDKIHKAGFDAKSFRHNFQAKPGRKERRKMEKQ
jgi:hypothetical protein